MREKGEVTVFLAMILVMIMTLLLVMAESARTAGQRLYLRVASNSAMESLMAQYHRAFGMNTGSLDWKRTVKAF